MVLKLLLKRGALLVTANWPVVAIQFAARTTFQVLLAVPVIGAAVLVAILLGGDLGNLLQGSLQDMAQTIAGALGSEPVAMTAFVVAFGVVLLGGSVFMFLVKGGTMSVLVAAEAGTEAIERQPLTFGMLRAASRFTTPRFLEGCSRYFGRYLALGLGLTLVYGLTAAGYVTFVTAGYRSAGDRFLFLGWTVAVILMTVLLVAWVTFVNLIYLLMQVAVVAGDCGLGTAAVTVTRFVRAEYREIGGVVAVALAMVVAATVASALAWSGVGLIAFVPVVGLAVVPLQAAALLVRGLVFEYITLTALGAYLSLFHRHAGTWKASPSDDDGGAR